MESMSSAQAGKRVLVNVEGVFKGGMIVAFNTSEGCEFRGALLQTSSCSTCRYVLGVCMCAQLHIETHCVASWLRSIGLHKSA